MPQVADPELDLLEKQIDKESTSQNINSNIPPDFTDKFNTPIPSSQQEAFEIWKDKNAPNDDGSDYDLQGAFLAGLNPDKNRGHFPDIFKKPNHPTFSDQSKYNGVLSENGGIYQGGKWEKDDSFTASPTNISMYGKDGLISYFNKNEPNSEINFSKDVTPPPLWNDIKSNPIFQKLNPGTQKFAFTKWVQDSDKYLTQNNTPREALNGFNDYALKEGEELGVGIQFNPDGRPLTLRQHAETTGDSSILNIPEKLQTLPYSLDIQSKDNSVSGTVGRNIDAFSRETASLFTKITPDAIAKVWDYVTGTTPGASQLDRGITAESQHEKDIETKEGIPDWSENISKMAGNTVSTFIGGANPLRFIPLAAANAMDETYHNALDQGATPIQASASAGVAGTVSAAVLSVLGPLDKLGIGKVLGANSEAFLNGAYKPTVKEAAKIMGLNASVLAGTGAARQIVQNKFDQWDYDPNRPTTAGVADAALQNGLFALVHAPTMVKAFWDNRSKLATAHSETSNALVALDKAHSDGNPAKITKAETAYNDAAANLQELVTKTAQDAPEPTPEEALEAKTVISEETPESSAQSIPEASNPLDNAIAKAEKEKEAPGLPVADQEIVPSSEIIPSVSEPEKNPIVPDETAQGIGPMTEATVKHVSENPSYAETPQEPKSIPDTVQSPDNSQSTANEPAVDESLSTKQEPISESAAPASKNQSIGDELDPYRDDFTHDRGVFLDPKIGQLSDHFKRIVGKLADAVRTHGIKDVRIALSNSNAGIFSDIYHAGDTIFINPHEVSDLLEHPDLWRMAAEEEHYHNSQITGWKRLGLDPVKQSVQMFHEMTPESVEQILREYKGSLKEYIGKSKEEIDSEGKSAIAMEYSRMLQQRMASGTSSERVLHPTRIFEDSEQTKQLLAKNAKTEGIVPTLIGAIREGEKIDKERKGGISLERETTNRQSQSPEALGGDGQGKAEQPAPGEEQGTHSREKVRIQAIAADLEDLKKSVDSAENDIGDKDKSELGIWVKELANVSKKFAKETLLDLKSYTPRLKATMVYLRRLAQKTQDSNAIREHLRNEIPDAAKRGGIIRYIEAAGDDKILEGWEKATSNPELKKFYEAARNLTPEEKTIADKISKLLETYRQKAQTWGIQVNKFDNYFPHQVQRDPNDSVLVRTNNRIKTGFDAQKARKYSTMFQGEQAGVTYKTNDAADGVASYINDLDHAIASRQYVADLSKGTEKDGRPILAPSTSNWTDLNSPKKGTVHLVFDGGPREYMEDYMHVNIPALRNWAWAGDANGTMVMHQGDMWVHPQAAKFLNNIFGMNALSKWWKEPSETLAGAATKIAGKFLLNDINAFAKSNLFLFSPVFHPVQIGMEALGHQINPTKIEKIDFNNPDVIDAMDHSLGLHGEESHLLDEEGRSSADKSILGYIPGKASTKIREWNQAVQDWIFKTYIPSIKMSTYQLALGRNMDRFSKDIQSGKVTEDEVKYLTAEQVNNAYGHLNYAALNRSPGFQLFLRQFLLAPDFFEARARHLGQAITGIAAKSGTEQLKAMAMIGVGLAVSAQITNILTNGEADFSHPFDVRVGNRYYGVRSAPGDALRLFQDLYSEVSGKRGRGIPYLNNRMSPMLRSIEELFTGRNWRGEPTSGGQAITDFLAGNSPMILQGFASKVPALGQFFTTSKNSPVSPFEQALSALGVQVSRYSPISVISQKAHEWRDAYGANIGLKSNTGVYPTSPYRPMQYALEDGDLQKAKDEYKKLLDDNKNNIFKVNKGFNISINKPFTGSSAGDLAFYKSLDDHDKALFKGAQERRRLILQRFQLMQQQH